MREVNILTLSTIRLEYPKCTPTWLWTQLPSVSQPNKWVVGKDYEKRETKKDGKSDLHV